MLEDRNEALRLLSELGASTRLVHHAQTVAEVADLVAFQLQGLGIACDARLKQIGAVLHDAGKIEHPEELSRPGTLPEQAGQALLLSRGVQAEVARFCTSHAIWNSPEITLEERVAALADKLWKGDRCQLNKISGFIRTFGDTSQP